MSDIVKIIKKMLMDHSFEKDGYEYHFLSVEKSEEFDAYDFVVNVNLPKKNQSYCTGVFDAQINEILQNISRYLGGSFSYSIEVLVNGKEPKKNGLYVNEKKQKQVVNEMNRVINEITLRSNEGMLKFDVHWKKRESLPYNLEDVYIYFNFFIELSKFTLMDVPVKPNLKMIDEISSVLLEMIYENDAVKEEMEEVIYYTMQNEININNIDDLYFGVHFSIKKIDGLPTEPQYLAGSDLKKGMFI